MDDVLPAASLILLRQGAGGPPEILIVRRSASLAFAAGAFVFPGGRVDPADRRAVSGCAGLEAEDAAARVAAIRETREETGIGLPDDEGGLAALLPFARWLPQEKLVRRFDTRFYIGKTPAGAEPVADGAETEHAFWATASEVLGLCAEGRGRAIFPTRRLLERLARFASIEDMEAEARALPARIITPWIEQRVDGDWLCIPDDAGYPVAAERIETATRY